MALLLSHAISPATLAPKIRRMFEFSATKIISLERSWKIERGAPVFTVKGKYTTRGWTEWTQGFQYGSALLQFDATGEGDFLEIGRKGTLERMAVHLTHRGVHDHGFNNVSTYGNLWRLMREGRIPADRKEQDFYELALKVSGAVQAARWTPTPDTGGFIYSFNGPHSLFVDTMRSLRALALAHRLGHVLMGERDRKISLLERLIQHARTTAKYSICYGNGRDVYDVRGRTSHECLFNTNDGSFRSPASQQGFSPYTTWTRGLAWALCGFAEELEFLETLPPEELEPLGGKSSLHQTWLEAAKATADFYIENTPHCGVPYWDTGAPNLFRLGDYRDRPADPFNPWEPVDSSAAAIAAQGFLRLGNVCLQQGDRPNGHKYHQAGLAIAGTLMEAPYLSESPGHQGLLLHSIYHRPNAWDYVPPGRKIPLGESSMWGDYHLRELGLLILRQIQRAPPLTFFHA